MAKHAATIAMLEDARANVVLDLQQAEAAIVVASQRLKSSQATHQELAKRIADLSAAIEALRG